MFIKLLKFEWRYHSKQLSFYLFLILFLLLGFFMSYGGRLGATELININSPYQISLFAGMFSLASVFAIMFFCINAILRDTQYAAEEIIYSTPVKKANFYWSRFTGAFSISLIVYSVILLGFALGTFFSKNQDAIGQFLPLDYVYIWISLVLPNIFILTALLFSFSTLSRKSLTVYIGAVFIYALYWGCSIFLNSPLLAQATPPSPDNMAIAAVMDPFGLSAFFEQTMYWTPFQKNNQLISISGYFLWNRIVWLCFSVLLLGVTFRLFSFRKGIKRIKKKKEYHKELQKALVYKPVSTNYKSFSAEWLSFLSLIRIELSTIFKSLPFVAILLIWIIIGITEIYSRIVEGGNYYDSLYPATFLLVNLISEPLPFLGLLLIIFYGGELFWKERDYKINELITPTPATNTVFFLSKYVALLMLPYLLITVGIVIAITFQIILGYYDFDWLEYLGMFYFNGIELLFYGILTLFVHNNVSNKYVGMFVSAILIFLLGSSLSSFIGIEHSLLQLGRTPKVYYTDVSGFGNSLKAFHWYAIYWLSLGSILVILSFKLWKRGISQNYKIRSERLISGWKRNERLGLIVCAAVFIGTGGVIFYNTNIINEYNNSKEQLDLAELYERKYKKYDALEELYPMEIKTEVAFYPKEAKYTVKADNVLQNKSNKNINQVFISARVPLDSVTIEGGILIEFDSVFDIYIFEFKEALEPGEQVNFQYWLTVKNDGFENRRDILENGSYILQSSFMPSLGYRPSLEIKDAAIRKRRGLPKRDLYIHAEIDLHKKPDNLIGRVNFESIVSTSSDQIAIAPGSLIKQWKKGDREFYHYKAKDKIVPLLTYFSANYKLDIQEYRGITIEQYYNSDHNMNNKSVIKASKETLDYCISNFGEYSFDHLRIAEIPAYWPFGGQAMPGTISMVEDQFYLLDQRHSDVFDLVAKRTIHEIAHQWWGHILTPKITPGGGFFMEGLAKYTEAVIMEKHYGKGALWNLSEYANNRYFTGRSYSSEEEPPAYSSDGQNYILYAKDYTIMLALKELIGEKELNKILKYLVYKYGNKDEFKVTTLDFLNEVYKVTPPRYHVLIDDWFKKVVTYDLKINDASYQKLDNGQFKISIELQTIKYKAKSLGEEKKIYLEEPLQIGLFEKHPKSVKPREEILYLKNHNFNQDTTRIEIIVDRLPKYVTIDPYGTRLDKNRTDNLMEL